MTKEFSSIVELKSIREQKSRLSEREQELSSPILTDFSLIPEIYGKHSKKCTFYTLRFGCSFAAVNTIKPQLL